MLTNLIIAAFATWRISAMLSYEDGPFGVFEKFRGLFLYAVIPDYNSGTIIDNSFKRYFYDLISCVWCLSVWVAIPVLLALGFGLNAEFIIYVLTTSAGAICVESWNDSNE